MNTPTIGKIVHYSLSAADAEAINKRRQDASDHMHQHREESTGVVVHVGDHVEEGDVYPMIIVMVWPNGRVNGQVFLDGNDAYWVASVSEEDAEAPAVQPGTWYWSPRT